MNKLSAMIAMLAVAVVSVSCSIKHDEESCTMNGVAVDCATMHKADQPATPVAQSENVSFSCDTMTCQSGSQYCLLNLSARTERVTASSCMSRASSCTTCDCVEQNAQSFGSASSCQMISCQQNNSVFQISCYSH